MTSSEWDDVRPPSYYGLEDTDFTTGIEIVAWKEREANEWLHERRIRDRCFVVPHGYGVRKDTFTTLIYYLPSNEKDVAMLFKLTWAGNVS